MRWTFILMLFCFCGACQSKPTRSPAPPTTDKVTHDNPQSGVELFTSVAYGPRRTREIDQGISQNPAVQACIRGAASKGPINLGVEGRLTFHGDLDALQFNGADQDLLGCLTAALKTVTIGRGKVGPFKVQLSTDVSKNPGAKGLILIPEDVKKFE